jgi:uncharacterized membrane protein YqjE
MTLLAQQGDQPSARYDAPESASEHTVGDLAAQLSEQVARLVRGELALAGVELKQRAKRAGVGFGMLGASAVAAFFGGACLIAAAVIGLSNVLRPWFAAIVVGVALFLLAGLVVLPGWKGVTERRPPVPNDSLDSVKADLAAVRDAVQRGRAASARGSHE